MDLEHLKIKRKFVKDKLKEAQAVLLERQIHLKHIDSQIRKAR